LGYGNFTFKKRGRKKRSLKAHRVAWTTEYGSIPDGLWVLHKCDNPPCVNLEHLFLGTRADNSHDMAAKNRSTFGELNWGAKLTATQVAEIRRLHDGGIRTGILVAQFGVGQTQISKIVRRKSWARVP